LAIAAPVLRISLLTVDGSDENAPTAARPSRRDPKANGRWGFESVSMGRVTAGVADGRVQRLWGQGIVARRRQCHIHASKRVWEEV
jgi:hypothetical protein